MPAESIPRSCPTAGEKETVALEVPAGAGTTRCESRECLIIFIRACRLSQCVSRVSCDGMRACDLAICVDCPPLREIPLLAVHRSSLCAQPFTHSPALLLRCARYPRPLLCSENPSHAEVNSPSILHRSSRAKAEEKRRTRPSTRTRSTRTSSNPRSIAAFSRGFSFRWEATGAVEATATTAVRAASVVISWKKLAKWRRERNRCRLALFNFAQT